MNCSAVIPPRSTNCSDTPTRPAIVTFGKSTSAVTGSVFDRLDPSATLPAPDGVDTVGVLTWIPPHLRLAADPRGMEVAATRLGDGQLPGCDLEALRARLRSGGARDGREDGRRDRGNPADGTQNVLTAQETATEEGCVIARDRLGYRVFS